MSKEKAPRDGSLTVKKDLVPTKPGVDKKPLPDKAKEFLKKWGPGTAK